MHIYLMKGVMSDCNSQEVKLRESFSAVINVINLADLSVLKFSMNT